MCWRRIRVPVYEGIYAEICAENNSKSSSGSSASEEASGVSVGYVGVLGVLVVSFSVSVFTHKVIVENAVCKCISVRNYIQ